MEKTIVCVHGRDQTWEVKDKLQTAWQWAIRFGINRTLEQHGKQPVTVPDEHIILAHYGDLYRPDSLEASKSLPQGVDLVYEEALAESFVEEAQKRDLIDRVVLEGLIEELSAAKGPTKAVKTALQLLEKIPGFSDFALRFFVQDVDQYLHQSAFREKVLIRVYNQLYREAQKGKELLLVAHSLGTVVAYDVLMKYPTLPISAFITLGSPLGLQNYIYHKLLPQGHLPSFPTAVTGNWYNFYDSRDIVALVPNLASLFLKDGKEVIIDTAIKNRAKNPHASDDYLSNIEVGNAFCVVLGMI